MPKIQRKFGILNFKDLVLILSVLTMLYVNSSYNVAIISGTFTIGISFVCSLFLILVCKKVLINTRLLFSVIFLSVSILITTLFTGDELKDSFIFISAIIVAMIFVSQINFEKYSIIYTNIIVLIAIYSLIAYVIAITFPSIIRLFPSTYYRPSEEVYNLGFTFVNLRHDLIRNMGIFWEAGAYQTYLVLAILLEIFVNKSRKFALVALALALLTTWSTAGIINGLMLLLIYIIYRSRNTSMRYGKSIIIVIILAITLVSFYSFLPRDIQYASLGKILTFFNSDYADPTKVTSATVRFSASIEPIKAFMESPIYGVGYSGLKDSVLNAGHTMTTNTVVNWFAAYGIFFGLILCIAIYYFAKKLDPYASFFLSILIVATLLLSIITEQYLRNISILIFLLYGLSEINIRIKK